MSQGFSSSCLKNAPLSLLENMSLIFCSWLLHGRVTSSILVCAFIPLIKNSLKDPSSTESYRAIAASSLVLKLFESCIMLIWGEDLSSDTLQFGFKKKCSTSTASWMVQEVLQHYLKQGSKPVLVVLDCTKAFNLARFDILFGRLLEKLPAVVVRVLVYSYKEQLAWVRWGHGCVSDTFRITNGTRQGSVASPAFWSVYLDPLLKELRAKGIGCHIAGMYMGVVAYADDIVLLAPNRNAARNMLATCENFCHC